MYEVLILNYDGIVGYSYVIVSASKCVMMCESMNGPLCVCVFLFLFLFFFFFLALFEEFNCKGNTKYNQPGRGSATQVENKK